MARHARELTVVLKGHAYSEEALAHFPKAAALLNKGKAGDIMLPPGSDALLFDLFGISLRDDRDIPVAAVTRLLDLGVVDKGWWLRADPVHLVPGRKGLLMVANQELELSNAESEDLVKEIAAAVLDEGWILKAPNPHRWYLKPSSVPEITTTPLDVVMGKDIDAFLPDGDDARNWHTRLNEIQILLHTSKINEKREANNKLTVNSVWFWGGGTLPQLGSSSWSSVSSDDVVALALARLSDAPHKKLPSSFALWLEQSTPGNHLVVFGRNQITEFLAEGDAGWIESLSEALKQKRLSSLTVYFDNSRKIVIRPDNLKPRWNWRFPFSRS